MGGMLTSRMVCGFFALFMLIGLISTDDEREISVALPGMIASGIGWFLFDSEIRKARLKQDD